MGLASAEYLKYGSETLAQALAQCLNCMFETHHPIELGQGTLIPLPKPNKKKEPPGNLRPIVLLNSTRKALSLLPLRRIQPAVDSYLSASHSGFRPGRSTADAVWTHRWLAAITQKYHATIEIHGIDMSKAFDTISREKLLAVVNGIVKEDEVRLIQVLLSNTSLSVLACKQQSSEFETTIGTPQSDCLSPVLFVIYLESALRYLRATLPPRPPADDLLPGEVIYADDTDFLSSSRTWLDSISPSITKVLREWHLKVNEEETEQTTLRRAGDRLAEIWRKTRKLGSLLGDEQDVIRRKQLATAAFRSLFVVWCRRELISEKLRLRLYQAFVIPVLTYNGGTWGLTMALEQSLDSFHRQQLRSLLGISWPQKMTNVSLYARCKAEPITNILKRMRWQLFGHILRLPEDTPASLAMAAYFTHDEKTWRGRPRVTIVTKLSGDLAGTDNGRLVSLGDLQRLWILARDRAGWRGLCAVVCCS
ncbi:uncharacterized protein LOC135819973 [Sycon ciliatum]|uniref:uncharacterized protein LOC135819973 n=1 Tax=Sycon ciliatum TaxID=27933 RepID=UPI0031F67D76